MLLDPELRLCWGSGRDAREAALRLFLVVRRTAVSACGRQHLQLVLYPWIPAQLEMLGSNKAGSNEGEDGVQGRAARARVHGMFACRIEKFAGRRRAGRQGGEGGGLRGACARSSKRPSVRCSSGCSLRGLGLRVQRCPHRPLLPLAHRP